MVDSSMTVEEIQERTKRWIEETVPYSYREIVCTCLDTKYDEGARTCLRCGKASRWRLVKCAECKEVFLGGGYEHHRVRLPAPKNWVQLTPDHSVRASYLCYTCLCKHDPPVEGDTPPSYVLQEVRSLDEIFSDDFGDFGDFDL